MCRSCPHPSPGCHQFPCPGDQTERHMHEQARNHQNGQCLPKTQPGHPGEIPGKDIPRPFQKQGTQEKRQ